MSPLRLFGIRNSKKALLVQVTHEGKLLVVPLFTPSSVVPMRSPASLERLIGPHLGPERWIGPPRRPVDGPWSEAEQKAQDILKLAELFTSAALVALNKERSIPGVIDWLQDQMEQNEGDIVIQLGGMLGAVYFFRWEMADDSKFEDKDLARKYLSEAVDRGNLSGWREIDYLIKLGAVYTLIHFEGLKPVHMDLALRCLHRAIEHAEFSTFPLRSHGYSATAQAYRQRFSGSGDLKDLDHAIEYGKLALQTAERRGPRYVQALESLSFAYLKCWEGKGTQHDLDLSVAHGLSAAKYGENFHGSETRFHTLGAAYQSRFTLSGDKTDLELAIEYHNKALLLDPHSQLKSQIHACLSICYQYRYSYCGTNKEDLEAVVRHARDAHAACRGDKSPIHSYNLALALDFVSSHNNDVELGYEACTLIMKVIQLAPKDHAQLVDYHALMADIIENASFWINEPKLYGVAMSIRERCLVVSEGSNWRDRIQCIAQVAGRYYRLFRKSVSSGQLDQESRDKAISLGREGARGRGPLAYRIECASIAASLAFDEQCLEDYAVAVDLFTQQAGMESVIHRRYRNIQATPQLIHVAVSAAFMLNRAGLAVEWLETARCLVWNQLQQLRTPMESLQCEEPSLANRFIEVSRSLDLLSSRPASSLSITSPLGEQISQSESNNTHTSTAMEYEKLLRQIRSLPNFQDFLRPPTSSSILSSLPSDGVVVIFNLHSSRCDAAALSSTFEHPLHIPLPDFLLSKANEMQKVFQGYLSDRMRNANDSTRGIKQSSVGFDPMAKILRELWTLLVAPVLKALGYAPTPPRLQDRRRIWWCPTGALSFLPIHAAGIYNSSQRNLCVSSFVVSSYTPAIRSLSEKAHTAASSPLSGSTSQVLLVGQSNTPNYPHLPSTPLEIRTLRDQMQEASISVKTLEDDEATLETVSSGMRENSWVHFACHGVHDAQDSLASGLCLQDGRLSLLELIRQHIPNTDFAFLSACQTSKGSTELSEEVVHIAAGMLAVGYRGVVGTMWNISDHYGPEFAKEFYGYLIRGAHPTKGVLDSTQAAYALDHATRKMREKVGDSDEGLLLWVPYVHFGY